MTKQIPGMLEIDEDRGVIYFHTNRPSIAEKYGSTTILRICRLPTPIPERHIDITGVKSISYLPIDSGWPYDTKAATQPKERSGVTDTASTPVTGSSELIEGTAGEGVQDIYHQRGKETTRYSSDESGGRATRSGEATE